MLSYTKTACIHYLINCGKAQYSFLKKFSDNIDVLITILLQSKFIAMLYLSINNNCRHILHVDICLIKVNVLDVYAGEINILQPQVPTPNG